MSAPERIAFDARTVNDRYHGIGRYAFRLLEALVEVAPERSFFVYTGRDPDTRFNWSYLASKNNVVLQPGPWPLYLPTEQLKWWQILKNSPAQVFYTPYFTAALLARQPQVVTIHDLIFERYPAYMPKAWARPYYRLLVKLSLRKARRIVAVSRATAIDLTHFYGIPPQKIKVVPEGVEPGFQRVSQPERLNELRRCYALPERFVLSVGARRPHKNLGRLVRAFAQLDQHQDVQLVFAGTEDPRFPDEARQAAESLDLNGRLRFLGWVPEGDLPGLYSLAEVVAFPSLVEGFGLPALEAMAHGTPVLAADAASLPEVVGEAGLLVDPLDEKAICAGLERLLGDAGLRSELAQAGLERARSFTWTRAAEQILAIFDSLV